MTAVIAAEQKQFLLLSNLVITVARHLVAQLLNSVLAVAVKAFVTGRPQFVVAIIMTMLNRLSHLKGRPVH